MRIRNLLSASALVLVICSLGLAQTPPATAPTSGPRLYVFDCGTIGGLGSALFDLKDEEIKGPKDFVTPCYLIVHPKGTLMWDVGQIPDTAFKGDAPVVQRSMRTEKRLLTQLAAVGYKPSDITYLAMSHYHSDHTANANEFAGSTWIVQEAERNAMFGTAQIGITDRTMYNKLETSKTLLLKGEDHDVFGDGTVIIKYAPGHTPGHQMLFLKLAKYGPLLIAGDLFHYPEERTLDRVPTFDADREQTRRTRKVVEQFIKQSGAEVWIEHDTTTFNRIKKAPAFYE